MKYKQKVMKIIEKNNLKIIKDDFELFDDDFVIKKRHIIEIAGNFDEDLTSLICFGWEDAYNRLCNYYF